MVVAVSVCPPECGRSRETLQTTLESSISRFWKCIFFNIFKNIVKSIGFPWIWSKVCSRPNISTNNENLRYYIRDIFYLLLYFVLTNYEAIPTIIRVNVPISLSNPMSDPLTGGFAQLREQNPLIHSKLLQKKPRGLCLMCI